MTDSSNTNHNNGLHQDEEKTVVPEIRFLRFGNGEDVIAWAAKLDDVEYEWYLMDPVVVIMEVDPDEQKQTCIMMPWLPLGIVDTNDCLIPTETVMVVKKVDKDVETYYKQLTEKLNKQRPTIIKAKQAVDKEGKNVFGFNMNNVRPLKGIKNEKQEEQKPEANT